MLTLDHSMINWKRSRVSQVHPWPPWDPNRSRPLDLGRFGDQPRIGTAHIFEVDPGLWPYLKKNNGEPTSHSFRNQSLTRNITISWIKDPVSNRASDKLQNWENYIQKNRQPRIHLIITHHFPSLFRHFSITFPSLFLVILWRYCWYVHGTWHLRPRRHGRSRSPRSPDTRLDPKRRERSLSRCRSCRRGDVWCPCHRCHDR